MIRPRSATTGSCSFARSLRNLLLLSEFAYQGPKRWAGATPERAVATNAVGRALLVLDVPELGNELVVPSLAITTALGSRTTNRLYAFTGDPRTVRYDWIPFKKKPHCSI